MKNQSRSSDLELPRKRKKLSDSDTSNSNSSEDITSRTPKYSSNRNQSIKPNLNPPHLSPKTYCMTPSTKKQPSKRKKSSHSDDQGSPISSNAKKSTVIFPHITESNWKNFKQRLEGKPLGEITKKQNACFARMHGHEALNKHFMGVHVLRLSIVDALLKRKWNNLLQLVVRLGRNYPDPVYKPFIRNLCDILKHYHPAIKGTDFEEQLDMIKEKHEIVHKQDQGTR